MASSSRNATQRDPAAGVFGGLDDDIQVVEPQRTTTHQPTITTNNNSGYVGTFATLPPIQRSTTEQKEPSPTDKIYYELVPGSPQLTNPSYAVFNKAINKIVAFFNSSKK